MLSCFDIPDTTRDLYFKLSNSFQLADPLRSPTYKIAGLYSIHKNDKCYYVGQSKNLPSRLADHLSGKYEPADEFRVYFICESGFDNFYQRSKKAQKSILETNESRLMQILKPIDNIVIDHDIKIEEQYLFDCFVEEHFQLHHISGFIDEYSITIFDSLQESIMLTDKRLRGGYHDMLEHVNSYAGDISNG